MITVVNPWMIRIHEFDGLEISPCRVVRRAENREIVETCEPEAATFWTVYGCCLRGDVEAFRDFPVVALGRAFARDLLEDYPHLRRHGLTDNGGR